MRPGGELEVVEEEEDKDEEEEEEIWETNQGKTLIGTNDTV